MLSGCIACHMRSCMQQLQFYLQRRIAQESGELSLRSDFCRHQIQDGDFQWPYVLGDSPIFCYDKNIFALQRLRCGQRVWNFNWQRLVLRYG